MQQVPSNYDKYYLTSDLFGQPYKELLAFFSQYPERGTVLDYGCGQGRDAIALAHLGYFVTGVDRSRVGVAQMLEKAMAAGLLVEGVIADIYNYQPVRDYNIILFDSMFHFLKKDKEKETALIRKVADDLQKGGVICFCIQSVKAKETTLKGIFTEEEGTWEILHDSHLKYVYYEKETGHTSITKYNMFIIKKMKGRAFLPDNRPIY
jgi:tellurite methyltransferase